MKRSWLLVCALLATLGVQAWALDDKAAEEDKKFEGTWVVTAMEVGGQKVPEEGFKEMTFTFTGKKYVQKVGDQVVEAGTQDLNPSKTPKHMDINVTEGETKGQKQLAIYEIDGDKAKICAANHGDTERPAKFETKEGSKNMIFELKRKKD
ncbi:MAG TPA: TIGR03067 domain-containing protein [Gemmatales bacterium]|nr:TIGR03067 domain-containing protein [Gemmatales bacterium]